MNREKTNKKIGNRTGFEIAVIGMDGRFPGAKNIHQFWENLKNGIESIAFFSREELEKSGNDPLLIDSPNFIKAKGFLEDTEYFDASFFNYTPAEAEMMDPQIRIFHQCAWKALEDAGYNPYDYNGLIGVYAGYTYNVYWKVGNLIRVRSSSEQFAEDSLNSTFFATRICYKLNLKGPGVTLNSACSTSLVAIHTACRALLTGETTIALAGGVTVTLPPKAGAVFQPGMITSNDGHCRAFDQRATGIIRGDGAAVVVLKRLDKAMADRDHIYAIIKGSAINNDGSEKVGYTAPGIDGQAAVIKAAQRMAETKPETITYIETHGTGTTLGDPIEVAALTKVFRENKKQSCRIGSLKTNVGHLDAASGAAGFIKTVLALYHRLIPPSLHYENPNPKIDFQDSPFIVNTEPYRWKRNGQPLRAGVNSFGVGGTNAHVILEEFPGAEEIGELAPLSPPPLPDREYRLILLSAKTETALEKMTENLAEYFKKNLLNHGIPGNPTNPGPTLADIAYTLQKGRNAFEHRAMMVCTDIKQALEKLDSKNLHRFLPMRKNPPLVFMFPGQGSQYVNMGYHLYRDEPLFRKEMDRCFEILEPLTGFDLKEILYPPSMSDRSDRLNRSDTSNTSYNSYSSPIDQTEIAQPLLFIFEYALAQLLSKWGIKPYAMIGHSIGEYTAACLSGVFSLEQALKVVVLRGKLMQALPHGEMVSAAISPRELNPLLDENTALAAVNTPDRCVVSGTPPAISHLARLLEEKGYETRKLHTSHAFHSPIMDTIMPQFTAALEQITLDKPKIPYISNLTGTWIREKQAQDPGYWAQHLRQTVRFSDGIDTLIKEPGTLFLEIGPGKSLSTFLRQHRHENPDPRDHNLAVELLRHPKQEVSDTGFLVEKIGQLWLYGLEIDWDELYNRQKRTRIPLPTYPFEKNPHNIEKILDKTRIGPAPASENIDPTQRAPMENWFYLPSWKRLNRLDLEIQSPGRETWLVFKDNCRLSTQLVHRLKKLKQDIIEVKPDRQYKKTETNQYYINPQKPGDYNTLFQDLETAREKPTRVLHLWTITGNNDTTASTGSHQVDLTMDRGFYSLLNIARAVTDRDYPGKLRLTVISDNIQEVTGEEEIQPVKAALLAAVRIIPKEYSKIECRSIDIKLPAPRSTMETKLVRQLIDELYNETREPELALRGKHRWEQRYEPINLPKPRGKIPFLEKKGVYLITGGMGGIGFELARYLAVNFNARLILVSRTSRPGRDKAKCAELENAGAEVLLEHADVSEPQQMKEVFDHAIKRFGKIQGIIHSAGISDYAGIIHRRTRQQSEAVIAPKIKGTLILDELIKEKKLKPGFLVLCSSLASVLAPFGEVAYTAANIFLNAFALQNNLQNQTFTVTIAWSAWQEVGMSVLTAAKMSGKEILDRYPTGESIPIKHPLFHKCLKINRHQVIFISHLNPKKHWILDEHRILGKPTIPGTAYLEIARAAIENYIRIDRQEDMKHHTDNHNSIGIEMKDVYFTSPLMLQDEEEKEVHTILKKQENTDEIQFSIVSWAAPHREQWQEHARGQARPIKTEPTTPIQIEQIEQMCTKEHVIIQKETQPSPTGIISFGPRWQNMSEIRYGENCGILTLELPTDFSGDMQYYKLHPALMDAATSFLAGKLQDQHTYLPVSYRKIQINAPLQEQIFSHATYNKKEKTGQRSMEFDISIMDKHGNRLVDIKGFTVTEVSKDTSPQTQLPGSDILKHGIRPNEGIDIFERTLAASLPQLLISTTVIDLQTLVQKENRLNSMKTQEEPARETDTQSTHPRPPLSTPYTAPQTRVQETLARIWENFLGIRQIGITDDFFELGGDSLKAMTVVNKINKEFQVEVPLTHLFNNPTIRGLEEIIDTGTTTVYSAIEPEEKREYYPLSSAQKRVFFLVQMQKNSIFYNLPQLVRLNGKLHPQRMQNAFQALLKRRESLRTFFLLKENEPIQRIDQIGDIDFQLQYTNIPASASQEDAEQQIKKIAGEFVRPFDLDKPPLLRSIIIHITDDQYAWFFDIHHIITDATGYAILLKDLYRLYNQEILPPLKLRYIDFSMWQNRQFARGELKKQEQYWLNLYADIKEIQPLEFPLDFPRPGIIRFAGKNYFFKLEEKEKTKFTQLGSNAGTTLFNNILATFALLLYKYTGQQDIIIGTSIAGRPHDDLMEIVGMFANMLAIRNKLDEHMTYMQFLTTVKQITLEAFENQDMQFEQLVEKLNLETQLSRNPLFDVCINIENYEQASLQTSELQMAPYTGYEASTSKFDMALWVNDTGNEIHFILEYSTELFKQQTIEIFAQRYIEIIKQVADNSRIKLKDIKLSHRLQETEAEIPSMEFEF